MGTALIASGVSLCAVLAWAAFLLFSTRHRSSNSNGLIAVRARTLNDSTPRFFKKIINLSETVVYIDMWRSHWCTYYNDREFFFTPRINELAQRLRAVGVPVVHISMGADAYTGRTRQRKAGRHAVKLGNLSVLENYHAQAGRYHKDYIPGFQDTCVYRDQTRFGRYRDNHLTKSIAVASDDLFVQNFKDLHIKAEKAIYTPGAAFLNIMAPCPRGWRYNTPDIMEICKLGVETCYWPLFEVVEGKWILNYEPKHKKPIEEFLRPQGRFKHLFKKGNEYLLEAFQKEVDRRWEELLFRCSR